MTTFIVSTTDDDGQVLYRKSSTCPSRIGADLGEAHDRFIAAEVTPFRSRQDAFQHIVRIWLSNEGYMPRL